MGNEANEIIQGGKNINKEFKSYFILFFIEIIS